MQSDSEAILSCCLCSLNSILCPNFVHSLGQKNDSTVVLRSQHICNLCIQELHEYHEAVERLQKIQERFKQMISVTNEEPEIAEHFFPYDEDLDDINDYVPRPNTRKSDDINEYLPMEMPDIDKDNIIEETAEFFGNSNLEFNTHTEWLSPLNEETVKVEENDEDVEGFKTRCLKCNKVFFNKIRYKDHYEFEHRTDPNVLVCHVCHRLFKSLEVLLLHKNIHEGKTEKQCRYCDKSYTKKENVLRHMQIHWHKSLQKHEIENEKVECTICTQVFKNKRTLKTHMLTHDKNRVRYKCNFCLKSFTEKYRLKLHCQNQHLTTVQ